MDSKDGLDLPGLEAAAFVSDAGGSVISPFCGVCRSIIITCLHAWSDVVGAHLVQIVIGLATVTVELANRTTGRLGRPPPAVKAGQSFGEERHVTTWRSLWENE